MILLYGVACILGFACILVMADVAAGLDFQRYWGSSYTIIEAEFDADWDGPEELN